VSAVQSVNELIADFAVIDGYREAVGLFHTSRFCADSCCRSFEECPDGCVLDVAAF
jgi:hypothetical protein